MNTYFKNVQTLEELRSQYKALLKKYHPDNGGSEEITKAINAEYEQLFHELKNRHATEAATADGTSYDNMKYDFSEDEKLREILNKIIHFNNITIEIVGCWIWCFNSYAYRKELKELGFKFAGQKKAWYWHSEAFKKKSHKVLTMEDIRSYYGSTKYQTERMTLIEA